MRRFTFLGTGTSQGVPVIGCTCAVCLSADERDKRLRTAALLHFNDKNFVIDAGPDFRQQLLRQNVNAVEAILITHQHNDHVAGLDDVRPLNFSQQRNMPLYATDIVERDIRQRFGYAFEENPYPGAPQFTFRRIDKNTAFDLNGIKVIPIEVQHGNRLTVMGFRFDNLTYITDAKNIDTDQLEKMKDTEFLIINALHFKTHPSHLDVSEAIAIAEVIGATQTYFTHVSHRMGKYSDVQPALPRNIGLAFDGLEFGF